MPLGTCTLSRGRLAFHGWFALCVACTPPDGSGLFEPLPANGSGGAGGSNGGAAGASSIPVAGAAAGGASSAPREGQAGSLQLVAGAGGVSGSSATGETFEGDASLPDAGVVDAGVVEEAGPPPVICEPSAEVCDGIDSDCDGVIDQGQTCRAGCVGFALDGHGYMFCTEPVDRGIALARCAAEGMKLAWLETPRENAAVVAAILGLDLPNGAAELLVQIGASDSDDEDEWFWIGNGAAFDGFRFWSGNATDDNDAAAVGGAYENWADGEPNDTEVEDCGVLSVSGSDFRAPGEWDDRGCELETPFVCETP